MKLLLISSLLSMLLYGLFGEDIVRRVNATRIRANARVRAVRKGDNDDDGDPTNDFDVIQTATAPPACSAMPKPKSVWPVSDSADLAYWLERQRQDSFETALNEMRQ